MELIKAHAQASHDVLCGMEWPWPVATVALQHHERLDGSGYPNSLHGDQIIPEARIMAVADVVEAMSSHRPYRASLGIDRALVEIESGSGILYDTSTVNACLNLFRKKGFQLPNKVPQPGPLLISFPPLAFEPGLQVRKRIECGRRKSIRHRCAPGVILDLRMFMLVAISAQQLPVAAIRRVVVVIAVFMMNFKQLQIGMGEGTSAAPAHPRIKLQRLRAITFITLVGRTPRFKDYLVEPVIVLRHQNLLYFPV
jgi:hypothetical protein